MAVYCRKCGTLLPDGSRFCGKCGTPVGTMPKPAEVPKVTVPDPGTLRGARRQEPAPKPASGVNTLDKKLIGILVILLAVSALKYPGFLVRKQGGGSEESGQPVFSVQNTEDDPRGLSTVPEHDEEWPYHSAAVDFEPVEGIHVTAEENMLYEDTEIKITPVEQNDERVIRVINELREEGVYALGAWHVDAGLAEGEHLPGRYSVEMNLRTLGIPESLYDSMVVLRLSDSGEITLYDTAVNDGILSYSTNQNSVAITATVGIAVLLTVGIIMYNSKVGNFYYFGGRCHQEGSNDYGSWDVIFRMRDVYPEKQRILDRMEEINQQLRKDAQEDYDSRQNEIDSAFVLERIFMSNIAVADRLKTLQKQNAEYAALEKELEIPKVIQYILDGVGTAYTYLGSVAKAEMPGGQVNYKVMVPEGEEVKEDNYGTAESGWYFKTFIKLFLKGDMAKEIAADTAKGKEYRDNMLLTITHETFHICQENYRTKLLPTDSNRFDEMVTLVLESDAKDYYKEKKIITTDPELTNSKIFITLHQPIDNESGLTSTMFQNEGYTLSRFVQYLRTKTGKKVTPVQIMKSRSYLTKPGTSEPLKKAFGLSEAEFDVLFRKWCLSSRTDFMQSYWVNWTDPAFKPVMTDPIGLVTGQGVHVNFRKNTPYSAVVRRFDQKEREPRALLMVPDTAGSNGAPGINLVPMEEYVKTDFGAFVPAQKQLTHNNQKRRFFLEVYGNQERLGKDDIGYKVYEIGPLDAPKLEQKDNKLVFTLPAASDAVKDDLIKGAEIYFESSDGKKAQVEAGKDVYGQSRSVPLEKLKQSGTTGSFKVTVTMKEYVLGTDGKRYYCPESKPAVIQLNAQAEETPTPAPETEAPSEPIAYEPNVFGNLPLDADGLTGFEVVEQPEGKDASNGGWERMDHPSGGTIEIGQDNRITIKIASLDAVNSIRRSDGGYTEHFTRDGIIMTGEVFSMTDDSILAAITELPMVIRGTSEEITVSDGDTMKHYCEYTFRDFDTGRCGVEITLKDGQVTRVRIDLHGSIWVRQVNTNWEDEQEVREFEGNNGASIRLVG